MDPRQGAQVGTNRDPMWSLGRRIYFLVGAMVGLILLWAFLDPRTSSRLPTVAHQIVGVLLLAVATAGCLWFAFARGNIFAEIKNQTISNRRRVSLGILALVFALGGLAVSLVPSPKSEPRPDLLIGVALFAMGGLFVLFWRPKRKDS